MTRDLRTFAKNVREHWARACMGWNPVCNRGAAVKADAIGRAAVQADAIGERAVEADVIGRRAAAEAGAIGEQQLDARRRQTGSSSGSGCRNRAREQQLKRTQSGRSKADAIGEKQLFRELSGAGLRTVGEQGGSS